LNSVHNCFGLWWRRHHNNNYRLKYYETVCSITNWFRHYLENHMRHSWLCRTNHSTLAMYSGWCTSLTTTKTFSKKKNHLIFSEWIIYGMFMSLSQRWGCVLRKVYQSNQSRWKKKYRFALIKTQQIGLCCVHFFA